MLCLLVGISVVDIYRQRFLEDVADAEKRSERYLLDVKNREKLTVSDSFYSFGGPANTNGLSLGGLDQLPLTEKRVWIASRLWAICQKIRRTKKLPPQAGFELGKYKDWLEHPRKTPLEAGITRKEAGRKGGNQRRQYSRDLDELIERIVRENSADEEIAGQVFYKLKGESLGVIEKITIEILDGKEVLMVHWDSNDHTKPERTETFQKGSIRKKVNKFI